MIQSLPLFKWSAFVLPVVTACVRANCTLTPLDLECLHVACRGTHDGCVSPYHLDASGLMHQTHQRHRHHSIRFTDALLPCAANLIIRCLCDGTDASSAKQDSVIAPESWARCLPGNVCDSMTFSTIGGFICFALQYPALSKVECNASTHCMGEILFIDIPAHHSEPPDLLGIRDASYTYMV